MSARSHPTQEASPYVSVEEAAELLDVSLGVFRRQVLGAEVPLRNVGTDQVVARTDLAAYLDRLAERARPEPLPAPGEGDVEDYEPEDPGRPRVRDPWLDHVSEGAAAAGQFYDRQSRMIAEQHRRDVAEGAREAATESARITGQVVEVGPGLDEFVGGLTEAASDRARQLLAEPALRAAVLRTLGLVDPVTPTRRAAPRDVLPDAAALARAKAVAARVVADPASRAQQLGILDVAPRVAKESGVPLEVAAQAVAEAVDAGLHTVARDAPAGVEVEDWTPQNDGAITEAAMTETGERRARDRLIEAARSHAL
jgi:hypothetical protein